MFAFVRPVIDWHAFAPEIVVVAVGCALTVFDFTLLERGRKYMPALTGLGFLATLIPILTLAVDGADRSMFGGAYVVDNFALILKALFLVSGYIVVLLSTNYLAEGDYWESEYYLMLTASITGMMAMSSARDLVTIFVALELLSIPAYLMATWRKRDLRSNEAGLKYYLMGVFASAIMLYGMSLVFGFANSTLLADINQAVSASADSAPIVTLGIVFIIVGFAFKVSAVPFHTWAPDTYEGAPTPVTSFLAVASKAAGFVALMQLVFVGFLGRADVVEPLMWILAAASMTVGNLIALRQTNIVRMLAYSGIAQAGYIMAPFAVAGSAPSEALSGVVVYLLIYAVMNLGLFGVVIAVARKTRSAEIATYGGLFEYAPGLTVLATVFLFSLAGIPPLGGWFAKLVVFRAVAAPSTTSGIVLGVLVAVNSVIALFYYAGVAKRMWFDPVYDGDRTPIRTPPALAAGLALTALATVAFGVFPGLVSHFTEFSSLVALGR
ncbi:MAG: NADH-quinone oxidoreductase subunit N [Acidimicrobiales bacterium]